VKSTTAWPDLAVGTSAAFTSVPGMRSLRASMRAELRRLAAVTGREFRMRRPPIINRRKALAQEVQFWRNIFATGGLQWPEEYRFRIDPEAEVNDPILRQILEKSPHVAVSILDVGAGPITGVGFRYPGKQLVLTAVDPLADAYDCILREHGIEPSVRTQRLRGEDLLSRFAPDSFDVAFARNALDHTLDPLPIIENMVAVIRPGGHVVLRHVPNEAVTESYEQLHQWNFDEREGRCVVWRRPGRERDVAVELGDGVSVSCTRDQFIGYEWVCCTIRKR
jgi:SAM-dependent methyltransferase